MTTLGGYLCAAVSVLFFGSNFAVVAKYDAGDGMLFQLVLCLGIWFTGLCVMVPRNPAFYPIAMIGGVIWCSGNCLTVYIIQQIGLGPGLVTWGTTALIIGWLTGFFGLFGLQSDQPCLESPGLNVVGLAFAMAALAVSTLIRKTPPQKRLLGQGNPPEPAEGLAASDAPWDAIPRPDRAQQRGRAKGILASLIAGTCYGLNFLPSTWIQQHVAGASQQGLDYVFNQFCGILAASMLYFLVYCLYKGNKPQVNPEIMLPGFISGVMWAIAQSCWFVANVELGYSAAFPIILIGPGLIGSLWSVFLFKDIEGHRNYLLLVGYFVLAAISCGPWPEQLATEGIGVPMHILVIVGRNEVIKTRLEHALNTVIFKGRRVLQGGDPMVTVEVAKTPGRGPNATYVSAERLALLMDLADAIIAKPGGGTTAEIAYRGLPAVFDATQGLLHWEDFTVHTFEDQGCGERFETADELPSVLRGALRKARSTRLVEDPSLPGEVLNPGPRILAEIEQMLVTPCVNCQLFSDTNT
ncbi:Transmembrane protein 144 [Durusdinium trenchii]|uniref:Transmembrane protein 144 n=1 Tax=Durusdinium trenchii TaxID=1381693 RepID=A0ABP0MD84_9DINO